MSQHLSKGVSDLVITCIKGDGKFLKFWALPTADLDTVKWLESRLETFQDCLKTSIIFTHTEQIPIGFKCVVKSKNRQNLWCRAVVLAHQGYYKILVRLLDYGHQEVVLVSDARHFDDPIMAIQPQAIQCILADIMPLYNEWTNEAIKFCEQYLLYNTFSFYVVSEYMQLPVVRVSKNSIPEAIVQRLVNGGLILFQRNTVPPPPVEFPFEIVELQLNSKHSVKISYFENAQKFYVQLSVAEIDLKHLMDSINRLPKDSFDPLKVPAVNTPCLAQLPTKHFYYRAVITHILQNVCKVFFVDYGFTEQVVIHELRAIPPAFLNLAAQSICCSLPKETDIESEELKRLIGHENLELLAITHTSEFYVVKLFFRPQDLPMSLCKSQNYSPQKLDIKRKYEVTVSYIKSVSEFYCQLTNMIDHQNIICNILNTGYNFFPIFLNECTPGKPVCAKYSEDNLWYRGRIVKANHENNIEIFFVDFGNYDNTNLSNVRKIGPDLLKFPMQAFKCFLHETSPPIDSKTEDDAIDLIEQFTSGQNLLAHINTFTGDAGYGITLHMQYSKLTVNEKILSIIRSEPVVPAHNTENVFVASFDSCMSFFVHFEKINSEKLANMQKELNTFYSGLQNNTFVPKKGFLVCARFYDYGQYYRARVEDCKNEKCDVFSIDYGYRASIPVRDIHVIDLKFNKYPLFGTECAFENISSKVPNDELSEVMLENSFRLKMVRKEGEKWYVLPAENFSGNAALLKFLKQFESSSESNRCGLDKLSENFGNLFNDKDTCDATLKVMDKEYRAHRSVLTARSSVFADAFKHNTLEKQTGVITITDCDPNSFGMFLEYLYSGKVEELSFSSARSLYYTSDKYNVQQLKELCVEYLMQSLSVENVCEVAAFAEENEVMELFNKVKDFFIHNSFKILFTSEWESLLNDDYRLANKLLREMAKQKLNN